MSAETQQKGGSEADLQMRREGAQKVGEVPGRCITKHGWSYTTNYKGLWVLTWFQRSVCLPKPGQQPTSEGAGE